VTLSYTRNWEDNFATSFPLPRSHPTFPTSPIGFGIFFLSISLQAIPEVRLCTAAQVRRVNYAEDRIMKDAEFRNELLSKICEVRRFLN
jgi:hypothetical protein